MALPHALDTDLLRAFVLIAEGRSFTQAAALVGRTQSAISMQVKRLEEILGQPVLSRGKGGSVELTPHGQYLLTYTPDKADDQGGYHKIALKADKGDLEVVTREGYYAPGGDESK